MTKETAIREEDLLINPELGFAAVASKYVLDKRLSDAEFRTYCCMLSMCPISKTINSDYNSLINTLVKLLGYRKVDICNYIIRLEGIGLIDIDEGPTTKIIFK